MADSIARISVMHALVIAILLFSGCATDEDSIVSIEESSEIAYAYVRSSEVFRLESAGDMHLLMKDTMECSSCYWFLYEFDTEDAVSIRMQVAVIEGEAEILGISRITGFMVKEETDEDCDSHSGCSTPMEYLVRSDCAYESRCIRGACVVVCPIIG